MSNAIGQSATQLATSSVKLEDFDFALSTKKCALREVKNNTKEQFSLKRQKLISAVCADVRNQYPTVFVKRDDKGNIIPGVQRLPEEMFDKVEQAVDEFIDKQFARIERDTAVFTVRHVPKYGKRCYIETRTIKSEHELEWKVQLLACHLDQGLIRRKLEDFEKGKSNISLETVEKLNKRLGKLNEIEENIKSHIQPVATN